MTAISAARATRPFDVVLFGATGFTGQLVAEYLAGAQPENARWAIAGRSREKLERVRADLVALHPKFGAALAKLPILLGDSSDEASLAAIAGQTRVVCTTVGPYAKYGRALIAACAAAGTDYCDLTGEPQFIRDSIDRLHDQAAATGARLVPACGFDSIPSDLGVHLLHEHFAARGQRLASAKLYVEAMRGGSSGGTIASMMFAMEEAGRDPALRRLMFDPYSLNPDREKDRGPDGPDQMGAAWDAEAQRWTGPFIMAAVNARVVRRSNALSGFAYGRDFRYGEVMSFKKGARGWLTAVGLSAGIGAFIGMAALGPTRKLVARVMPGPGEGPTKAQRENGFFRIRILGHAAPDSSGLAPRAAVRVRAKHDPGYGETSRMLGESALCLAHDDLPKRGGVLTPAVAMGTPLVERLRKMGMTWEVEDLV